MHVFSSSLRITELFFSPSVGDFNATTISGFIPDQFSPSIVDDTEVELLEGFIALLQLDRSSIDPRDLARIQYLNDIILVTIEDDG